MRKACVEVFPRLVVCAEGSAAFEDQQVCILSGLDSSQQGLQSSARVRNDPFFHSKPPPAPILCRDFLLMSLSVLRGKEAAGGNGA